MEKNYNTQFKPTFLVNSVKNISALCYQLNWIDFFPTDIPSSPRWHMKDNGNGWKFQKMHISVTNKISNIIFLVISFGLTFGLKEMGETVQLQNQIEHLSAVSRSCLLTLKTANVNLQTQLVLQRFEEIYILSHNLQFWKKKYTFEGLRD